MFRPRVPSAPRLPAAPSISGGTAARRLRRRARLFGLGLGALLLACSGAAAPATADPPLRVGRVGALFGPVSYHAPGNNDWTAAQVNYPVIAGASFWTEPGSRAELGFGDAVARLDHASEVEVAALDERRLALRLDQGVLSFRLRHIARGQSYQVITPRGTVDLAAPGVYDIVAGDRDHPTLVSVLQGRARLVNGGAVLDLGNGEAARVDGDPASPSFQITLAEPTPFDDWSLDEDRLEAAPVAERYVSPATPGYDALDRYGTWQAAPTYGTVWYPAAVPVGWAPYRFGHWAFVPPWGWTWIDDTPWGFAPFHYGRWVRIGPRWAWVPGTYVAEPTYAPALVAFIGAPAFSGTLVIGAVSTIAWVPLAPFEVYRPYYHCTPAYIRRVNITNVRNVTVINNVINNVTINRNVVVNTAYANHTAVTAVPRASFAAARPIARARLAVPAAALKARPLTEVAPPTPARAAPSAPQGRGHTAAPPPSSFTGPGRAPGNAQNNAPGRTSGHAPGEPFARPAAAPFAPSHAAPNRAEPSRENLAPRETQAPRENLAPRKTQAPRESLAPREARPTPPRITRGTPPDHAAAPPPRAEHPVAEPAPRETFRPPPHPVQRAPLVETQQGWRRQPAAARPRPAAEPHRAPPARAARPEPDRQEHQNR